MLGATAYSGLYGKIPALGDFVNARLPLDFVETWDVWLQAGLNAWRQSAGNDWVSAFDRAGGFRFALQAGVCGTAPVVGVVGASMDRVGRRFPLTIAAILPQGISAIGAALASLSWFDRAATALIDMGKEPTDTVTASIDVQLSGLDAAWAKDVALVEAPSAVDVAMLMQGVECRLTSLDGGDFTALLAVCCAQHMTALQPRLGLMWTTAPRMQLWSGPGLQPAETFANLFTLTTAPGAEFVAVPSNKPTTELAPPYPGKSAPFSATTESSVTPTTLLKKIAPHLLIAVPNVAYVAFGSALEEQPDAAAVARRFSAEFARSDSAPGACHATLGGTDGSCAAWLPDEEGGVYVWCGTATVFRLRGEDLERLTDEEPLEEGPEESLADLLGRSDVDVRPRFAETSRRAADVRPGDRILLCADGSYGGLSWAQLVSALREERPVLAARRLIEAWTQPAVSVPGAIVIAFDSEDDALVATHAIVANRVASPL